MTLRQPPAPPPSGPALGWQPRAPVMLATAMALVQFIYLFFFLVQFRRHVDLGDLPPTTTPTSPPVLSRAACGPALAGLLAGVSPAPLIAPSSTLGRTHRLQLVSRLLLAPAKDWGQPLRCSGACWGDVKDLGAGRQGAPAWGVPLQASLCLEWEVPGPDAYLGTKVASGQHRREPVLSLPLRVPWWKGHSSGEPCPLILWVPGVRAMGRAKQEASPASLSPLAHPPLACLSPHLTSAGPAPLLHPAPPSHLHLGPGPSRAPGLAPHPQQCSGALWAASLSGEMSGSCHGVYQVLFAILSHHASLDLFFPTCCVWSGPFYNTCVGFLLFCFHTLSYKSSHFY